MIKKSCTTTLFPGFTASVSSKQGSVAKPRPVALTRTLFYVISSGLQRDLVTRKVLYYPPLFRGPTFCFLANKASLKGPDW